MEEQKETEKRARNGTKKSSSGGTTKISQGTEGAVKQKKEETQLSAEILSDNDSDLF